MYCVRIMWCFRKEKEAISTLGRSLSTNKGLQVHGSCMCPDTDAKGAKPRPKGTHRCNSILKGSPDKGQQGRSGYFIPCHSHRQLLRGSL